MSCSITVKDQECSICFETLEQDLEKDLSLTCSHSFHKECYKKWGKDTCPLCRVGKIPCETIPEIKQDDESSDPNFLKKTILSFVFFFMNLFYVADIITNNNYNYQLITLIISGLIFIIYLNPLWLKLLEKTRLTGLCFVTFGVIIAPGLPITFLIQCTKYFSGITNAILYCCVNMLWLLFWYKEHLYFQE